MKADPFDGGFLSSHAAFNLDPPMLCGAQTFSSYFGVLLSKLNLPRGSKKRPPWHVGDHEICQSAPGLGGVLRRRLGIDELRPLK